ncbi:MAG: hypothetical protein P8L30_00755 [Longimicrobiales bacterium]|nr:hypothetical protein [Longimicrobiales bacterium]NCG32055.1 hypothetical protein [Pseudomonadota bacterium]
MPQRAPFDPEHVTHLFQSSLDEIRARGPAEVVIGGRSFNVTREFLEDLTEQKEAVHCSASGRSVTEPRLPGQSGLLRP